jgi:hypothetical protein
MSSSALIIVGYLILLAQAPYTSVNPDGRIIQFICRKPQQPREWKKKKRGGA